MGHVTDLYCAFEGSRDSLADVTLGSALRSDTERKRQRKRERDAETVDGLCRYKILPNLRCSQRRFT